MTISIVIYLLKVNNENTRAEWEICFQKTHQNWLRSGDFKVNFLSKSQKFKMGF